MFICDGLADRSGRVRTLEVRVMCEDFPACGHGPAPMGDDGGCPNDEGQFRCVECGVELSPSALSSICRQCVVGLPLAYEAPKRLRDDPMTRHNIDNLGIRWR